MSVRTIVNIDEKKCNGCGQCVTACAEGAIQIVDGKAKLVSDVYCDGLGACLGTCPQDAIKLEKREASAFDEEKAIEHVKNMKKAKEEKLPCGCPGTMARSMKKAPAASSCCPDNEITSSLTNWPVQLKLVPVNASYFQDAHLLLASDCVPFAFPNFHTKLLSGKSLVVGCPKLDDAGAYIEKLTEILKASDIKSLTVARMEVPCCSGMTRIAKEAVAASGKNIPLEEIILTINGEILSKKDVMR